MRPRTPAGAGLVALALVAGCSSDPPAPRGEIMIAVDSDMQLPKDMTRMRIEVSQNGNVVSYTTYDLGPSATRLPATLAVVRGSTDAPALLRVYGIKDDLNGAENVRFLRQAALQVPGDRIVRLRMPLQWLCDGTGAKEPFGYDQYAPSSFCASDQTCSAGQCVSANVDPAALPAWDPGAVFGGGTCFDAVRCFEGAREAVVSETDCTIDPPPFSASGGINVAIEPVDGSGVCSARGCLVVIDEDPAAGWSELGSGRIRLPAAVCSPLQTPRIRRIVLSDGCARKTASVPLCGPWSAVPGGLVPAATGPAVDGGDAGDGNGDGAASGD
jgi:hypothetical protein